MDYSERNLRDQKKIEALARYVSAVRANLQENALVPGSDYTKLQSFASSQPALDPDLVSTTSNPNPRYDARPMTLSGDSLLSQARKELASGLTISGPTERTEALTSLATRQTVSGGAIASDKEPCGIGIRLRGEGAILRITEIVHDSPAWRSSLAVGDVL
eukprot:CAMPEP_0113670168 /NCGR_PEP_ID=MMETSP0038_2-20120614/4986_1 /TAXON_ID=2898 /ORGANISM="Cryptomonas paramecium" /LENGTH=159 /DNA_ID=CAMNT_0000586153 /DNA_START=24 /DNA_END=499 /DNA_ORIENTATION=+ /assembly_acc=CAM_ASM_000170